MLLLIYHLILFSPFSLFTSGHKKNIYGQPKSELGGSHGRSYQNCKNICVSPSSLPMRFTIVGQSLPNPQAALQPHCCGHCNTYHDHSPHKLSNSLNFITVIITPFLTYRTIFSIYAFIIRNLLCITVTVEQAVMEYNARLKPINIIKNAFLEDRWHFTPFLAQSTKQNKSYNYCL